MAGTSVFESANGDGLDELSGAPVKPIFSRVDLLSVNAHYLISTKHDKKMKGRKQNTIIKLEAWKRSLLRNRVIFEGNINK